MERKTFFQVKNVAVSSIFHPFVTVWVGVKEVLYVWLLIPLGRCVTDACFRSVERARFRLVSVVNIAVGLYVTGAGRVIAQSFFFVDRWTEIIVVISESMEGDRRAEDMVHFLYLLALVREHNPYPSGLIPVNNMEIRVCQLLFLKSAVNVHLP